VARQSRPQLQKTTSTRIANGTSLARDQNSGREMSNTMVNRHLLAWAEYRQARCHLLDHLCTSESNREPMAEFAEILVRDLVGGRLAPSRTEKGWDVETPEGKKIQVRYLANRSGNWHNWHWVASSDLWDWYALVVFVDLQPLAVHMFPSTDLSPICACLKKRHANQDRLLNYTYGNFVAINADPAHFTGLGMRVFNISEK
jgi:hypothetical protein